MQKIFLGCFTVLAFVSLIFDTPMARTMESWRTQDCVALSTELALAQPLGCEGADTENFSQTAASKGTVLPLQLAQAPNAYPQPNASNPSNRSSQPMPYGYVQSAPYGNPQSSGGPARICVTSAGQCALPQPTYAKGSSCNCPVTGGGTYFGVAQ